jgi:hypothetical protein
MFYYLLIALVVSPVFWWLSARANARLEASIPGCRGYRFGYFISWIFYLVTVVSAYVALAALMSANVPTVSLVLAAASLAAGKLIRRRRRAGWLVAIVLNAVFIGISALFLTSGGPVMGAFALAVFAIPLVVSILYARNRWSEFAKRDAAPVSRVTAPSKPQPLATLSPLDAAAE